MTAKLVISGKENIGKTTLIKSLPPEETFVLAVDEKPFQLAYPHANFFSFKDIDGFVNGWDDTHEDGTKTHNEGVTHKIAKFQEKMGKLPKYVVIDTVSRVFMYAYDNLNDLFPNDNFKLYAALDREIKKFRKLLTDMQEAGMNVIMISHAEMDEKTAKYKLTGTGKFSKNGGFISTVDEAAFIDLKAKTRTVYLRGHELARTLLEDLPDSLPSEEYSLKSHIDMLISKADSVKEFRL